MARNNDLLYNAALTACFAALTAGSSPVGGPSGGYDQTGPVAVATAIDAAIAFDSTITTSSSNPAALAPSTSAIATNQMAKAQALHSIVFAVYMGKTVLPGGGPSSVLAALATNIETLYAAAITGIQTT
jgi:hypothetical protein